MGAYKHRAGEDSPENSEVDTGIFLKIVLGVAFTFSVWLGLSIFALGGVGISETAEGRKLGAFLQVAGVLVFGTITFVLLPAQMMRRRRRELRLGVRAIYAIVAVFLAYAPVWGGILWMAGTARGEQLEILAPLRGEVFLSDLDRQLAESLAGCGIRGKTWPELVAEGADPKATSTSGKSLMWWAVLGKHGAGVEWLAEQDVLIDPDIVVFSATHGGRNVTDLVALGANISELQQDELLAARVPTGGDLLQGGFSPNHRFLDGGTLIDFVFNGLSKSMFSSPLGTSATLWRMKSVADFLEAGLDPETPVTLDWGGGTDGQTGQKRNVTIREWVTEVQEQAPSSLRDGDRLEWTEVVNKLRAESGHQFQLR